MAGHCPGKSRTERSQTRALYVSISTEFGTNEVQAIHTLSSESVTLSRWQGDYSSGMLGPTQSPLGPRHTIELPPTEGMNSHAERFSPSHTTGCPYYLQRPFPATEGKRVRNNSIDERRLFGSEGNEDGPSAPLQKRIRMEQHSPMRSSASEERNTLGDSATRDNITSQAGYKLPQFKPLTTSVPLSTTHRELHIPLSPLGTHSKLSLGFPDINNSLVPTRPRYTWDREAIDRLTAGLSKVRGKLATLHNHEKGILEELARCGVSLQPLQPKIEETTPSLNDLQAQLMLVEIELQQEKIQRLRAERTLEEVEKECRSPFVVPALFQAFRKILDVGHGV
ncbi:hypothetical protein K503DRAFT_96729 [Rhizopogon vinicolor AM-OR11-026]|uniref:Uncharacterized protein n=1 Tax=Rhizopogon vinicolor AM-OR11-026 TaxID=1314800 RepID=A0A1B7N397_9AGAM|nr:hypothetical protein K503DRAFT_96729 [Rhizopogon vinicolor AM-OR11-026]